MADEKQETEVAEIPVTDNPEQASMPTLKEQREMIKKQADAFVEQYLSKDNPVLFMNAYSIIEDYPVFITELKKYLSQMTPQELTDMDIEQLIFANPRLLYEFFDSLKIFISVEGCDEEWSYDIISSDYIENVCIGRDKIKNRVRAEHEGFMKAIELVNNKK